MNFFSLHPSLEEAIKDSSNLVKMRLDIESGENQLTIEPEAIISAKFQSGFDAPGCVVSTGEVTFDVPTADWNWNTHGHIVKVFFTAGDCGVWLHRFTLYPDERGFRSRRRGGQHETVTVALEDATARMKRQRALRDWSESEVIIDGVFADKSQPDKSLLHRIAARAGIAFDEIDCCTVPLSLPYVKLSKSPWEELCDLTHASLAVLESGVDKKLVFSGSPYQDEGSESDEPYTLDESMFYSLESWSAGDELYNDIRLRWNKPERLERQEIWRYDSQPVEYDGQLSPMYRFSVSGEKRDIETAGGMKVQYRVAAEEFENAPVVYADEIDDLATVQAGMICDGPGLAVSLLNTENYLDQAVIGVECSANVTLRELVIWGRPVVMRLNQSCYRRDEESIDAYGHRILNVTGRYFSDDLVEEGRSHWEDWVCRRKKTLAIHRTNTSMMTETGLVSARVGGSVCFGITSISLSYISIDYSDIFILRIDLS